MKHGVIEIWSNGVMASWSLIDIASRRGQGEWVGPEGGGGAIVSG